MTTNIIITIIILCNIIAAEFEKNFYKIFLIIFIQIKKKKGNSTIIKTSRATVMQCSICVFICTHSTMYVCSMSRLLRKMTAACPPNTPPRKKFLVLFDKQETLLQDLHSPSIFFSLNA